VAEILLDRVTKVFPDGTEAVKELDLRIADGSLVVLVGPSGCGKTTVLRMIAGLEDATEGTIAIGGQVVNDIPPGARDVAMVFQNYALYPHMSVYQNMAMSLKIRRFDTQDIKRRVQEAARILSLQSLLGKRPRELSGGERQRTAMGRAIVRQPRAFLMDEPLSNLDAKLRVQMRGEILRIQRDLGVTTVYVTHDQTEAMTLGDQVAVMRKGVLQQLAAPDELYSLPANLFVAGFIGSPAMNLVPATLSRDDGRAWARFGEIRLALPDDLLASQPVLAGYLGKNVALGIRPEDMDDASLHPGAREDSMFPVTVDHRESLGSDVFLHFTLDVPPVVTEETRDLASDVDTMAVADLEADARERRSSIVVRTAPGTQARDGDGCRILVDTTKLYFFDPHTGRAILDDGRRAAGADAAPTVAPSDPARAVRSA
jgi:multiple sugar transport system ATP-binding protein